MSLYVLNDDKKVEVCDATMLNKYSVAGLLLLIIINF
jgi:hypothetical protein